ncbi:MAG: RHS repeat-associated core domain-containing protein [Anaeroplasmataceae bacterium]
MNPIRYRSYYYDLETGLFWCNSRYYNPEWGRWISPDSIEYLDPQSINGLNLYSYCMNDPVNLFDSNGHKPISIKWFNLVNTFDLTATLAQLIVGGAAIGGQYAVVNALRPNNIGIGLWNKQRAAAIAGFGDDVAKLNKVSNVLAAITVAVQVGEGIYSDINRGYSTDRVVSNAVVNTVIYGGTMAITSWAGAKAGAFIGSFCPVPVVGTVVGTAIGFAVGTIAGVILDYEVNGKSLIDYARDWVYNIWNSLFD